MSSARRQGLAVSTCLACAGAGLALPSAAFATFPGTNGRIAFARGTGTDFNVWTMNPDGTVPTQLTFEPANQQGGAWSPDGTKLAFLSNEDGAFDVWTMDANGTNRQNLTNFVAQPGPRPAPGSPVRSPDGSSILFSAQGGIHAVPATGGADQHDRARRDATIPASIPSISPTAPASPSPSQTSSPSGHR